MTNPFDDPEGEYLVLVNDEGQCSLWPAFVAVPAGWSIAHAKDTRQACLDHVEQRWTDMRPASLARRMDAPAACPFPFAENVALQLHPRFAELRREPWMQRVSVPYGEDAWLAVSYEHVRVVMSDSRFSRAEAANHDEARLTPFPIRTSILGMDPPDHTRLRRLLSRVFTQGRVERLRPKLLEHAERLVDELVARESPAELIERFVLPFSGLAICDLLGIPAAERPQFRHWIDGFASTSALPAAEVEARMDAMYAYIEGHLARCRQNPGDDLVSALVRACDEEERLTEKELLEFVTVLLIAGYDTVALELMSAVVVLLTHPEQMALVRAQPELWPQAVLELLRYIPLDAHVTFARYATEDVQVGATLVRAGEAVLPSLPSANRDVSVFERPDELDITRPKRAHFGLGGGIHRCAGAPLATVELQIALEVLLRRLPTLRLAVPADELPWRPGMLLRSLERLPVAW